MEHPLPGPDWPSREMGDFPVAWPVMLTYNKASEFVLITSHKKMERRRKSGTGRERIIKKKAFKEEVQNMHIKPSLSLKCMER